MLSLLNKEMLRAKIWSRTDIPINRYWRNQCWIWTGAITTDRPGGPEGGWGGGYGCMKIAGRWIRVHRLVWELLHGRIPKGKVVGHICSEFGAEKDNRRCVNPLHLRLVTRSENLQQAYDTGQRETKVPF